MKIAGLPQIISFLETFKNTAHTSFFLTRSEKNNFTMSELGYSKRDVINDLMGLNVSNYSEGPVQSRLVKSALWIFGVFRGGKEIYIKLELSRYSDPGELIPTAYCVSFHFSEHPMTYPYKIKEIK